MTKVSLTIDDVIKLVREQYHLPESVVVEIEGVQINKKDDHEWRDVPSDWKQYRPPADAERYDRIVVMCRDGELDVGHPTDWGHGWKQDGHESDIIKFRKAI